MSWNNNVSLCGYLSNDVELRKTETGKSVATFSIGVQKQTKEGGADFFNCVVWNNNADYMSKYGKKGCLTTLSGELHVKSYKKDGEQKTSIEVSANSVHVEKKQSNQTNQYESSYDEYEGI